MKSRQVKSLSCSSHLSRVEWQARLSFTRHASRLPLRSGKDPLRKSLETILRQMTFNLPRFQSVTLSPKRLQSGRKRISFNMIQLGAGELR